MTAALILRRGISMMLWGLRDGGCRVDIQGCHRTT